MSNSKPLSYESSKAVLQFMEPNRRFLLAMNCPGVRKLEKVVPLKIDSFWYHPFKVVINDTIYQLKPCRKYPEGVEVPEYHMHEFDYEEESVFFDKYGAPCSEPGVPTTLEYDLKDIECFETSIKSCEKQIEQWAAGESFEKHDPLKNIDNLENARRLLEEYQLRLQPFINRRENKLPEYEMMVELSIFSKDFRKVQYLRCLDIFAVKRKLSNFLFGQRLKPVQVKNFIVYDGNFDYLQTDLKLKVRNLLSDWALEDLRPGPEILIHPDSLPLDTLAAAFYWNSVLDLPIQKSARFLFLINKSYVSYLEFSRVSRLPNRHVHLHRFNFACPDFTRLLRSVLQEWDNREPGTCLSAQVEGIQNATLMGCLLEAAEPFGGVKESEWLIRIPRNNSCELHVSCDPMDTISIPDELKYDFEVSDDEEIEEDDDDEAEDMGVDCDADGSDDETDDIEVDDIEEEVTERTLRITVVLI